MSVNEKISASFSFRLGIFFGTIFLLVGCYMPFFPVWLDWKGLPPEQIGIVLSVPLIVRIFFTPGLSFLADKLEDHRFVLIVLAWCTLFSLALLWWADGFWGILGVSALMAVFWTTIIPLSETVAMTGVRQVGADYGRMRLWGSVTFVVASWGGGYWIDLFGPSSALTLLIATAILIVVGAYGLPKPRGLGRLKAATFDPKIRSKDALALARQPLFAIFVFGTSLIHASHAVFYGFGSLHWRQLGYSADIVGLLWAVGVIAEIVLFFYSASLFKKIGATRLLLLGALAAIIRWLLTATDPQFEILIVCQMLHAFSFGAAHLGAILFLSEAVPSNLLGTAQGLYAAVAAGLVMGAATVGAGWLYEAFAGHAFFAMAVMSFAGFVLGWVLHRHWDGKLLIGETRA